MYSGKIAMPPGGGGFSKNQQIGYSWFSIFLVKQKGENGQTILTKL
jgi:hypothetical protein